MTAKTYDASLPTVTSIYCAGPRGVGKSTWIRDLLLSDFIQPQPKKIIWVYHTKQDALTDSLKAKFGQNVVFQEEFPDWDQIRDTWVILDDNALEAVDDKEIADVFVRGRHRGISICLLSQALFFKGKYTKLFTNNSDYIVLFRTFRMRDSVRMLAVQILGKSWQWLMDSYLHAIEQEPFGHLLIENTPAQDDRVRLRGNIFSALPTVTVYAPVKKL